MPKNRKKDPRTVTVSTTVIDDAGTHTTVSRSVENPTLEEVQGVVEQVAAGMKAALPNPLEMPF